MEHSSRLISFCLVLLVLLYGCATAGASCDREHVNHTLHILYKEKNFRKAKAHIEACAAKGDAASQLALAIVCLDDDKNNTVYDHEKGIALAESAALQGYAPAQRKYAVILSTVTSTKDVKRMLEYDLRSLDWHYKAALQGHPDSLFMIGNTFDDKSFDKVSAYMWYWLALRRSKPQLHYHGFIVSALAYLKATQLTPAQIREAVKLAERWEKQHPGAAKSWPSDSYVENLKGKSRALIPPPQPGPVTERFCDKFGPVIHICPQYQYENDKKVDAFRKTFYGVE